MIDHYKLTDILSERLKIEIKTAGDGLFAVLEQLHRSLKEHGDAQLPGLGRFILDGDQVSFEPDPALEIDVNFRYHGLQPIVLEDATLDASPLESDNREIPETAVFIIDEIEPVSETSSEVAATAVTVSDTPDQRSKPNEPDATHHQAAKRTDLKTPPLTWRDPHRVPVEIRIDDRYVRKGERWRNVVGMTVFLLVIVAGAGVSWHKGWLAGTGIPSFHEVFPGYATRNDPGTITLESPTIEERHDQPLEQESIEEVLDTGGAIVAGESFGLNGTWQQNLTPFFTIVSATMFTERVANEIFDEVQAANTRARLFRVRVQGEIAWELQIGQFESRELAKNANLTLDRKFQSSVVRQYGQQ